MNKYDILKQHFGFETFRPIQEDAVDHILAKKDILTVLPTGSGKSDLPITHAYDERCYSGYLTLDRTDAGSGGKSEPEWHRCKDVKFPKQQ